MHEIPVFDRKVWFANCLDHIKRYSIGQYASGYGLQVLSSAPYPFVQCHQYQIHCSRTTLHTYAACYSYITVGVGYICYYTELRMNVNNNDMLL